MMNFPCPLYKQGDKDLKNLISCTFTLQVPAEDIV